MTFVLRRSQPTIIGFVRMTQTFISSLNLKLKAKTKCFSKHLRSFSRIFLNQHICLWESRDKHRVPRVYSANTPPYQTHTNTHTHESSALQFATLFLVLALTYENLSVLPYCSSGHVLNCFFSCFFAGQCSRHHHGRWAGICRPAQHHRQAAVWPGTLHISAVSKSAYEYVINITLKRCFFWIKPFWLRWLKEISQSGV